jgi:hypothetical protein
MCCWRGSLNIAKNTPEEHSGNAALLLPEMEAEKNCYMLGVIPEDTGIRRVLDRIISQKKKKKKNVDRMFWWNYAAAGHLYGWMIEVQLRRCRAHPTAENMDTSRSVCGGLCRRQIINGGHLYGIALCSVGNL